MAKKFPLHPGELFGADWASWGLDPAASPHPVIGIASTRD